MRETLEHHWQAVRDRLRTGTRYVTLQNGAAQKRVDVPSFKWTAPRVTVQFERDGEKHVFKLGTGEKLSKAVAPIAPYTRRVNGRTVQVSGH